MVQKTAKKKTPKVPEAELDVLKDIRRLLVLNNKGLTYLISGKSMTGFQEGFEDWKRDTLKMEERVKR